MEKIKRQEVSIVVVSENIKIMQEFYTAIEASAIEDKVIVIKREESDTQETLVRKINEVRELGLVRLEKFHMFSFIHRMIIVMGSKSFLKHILSKYPYIEVKEFIDITIYKEHRKIREVISRKNEIIVSNIAVCEVCTPEYKGLIKARIIYYKSKT